MKIVDNTFLPYSYMYCVNVRSKINAGKVFGIVSPPVKLICLWLTGSVGVVWMDGRMADTPSDGLIVRPKWRGVKQREKARTRNKSGKNTPVFHLCFVVPQCKGSFAVVISTDTLYAVRRLQSPAAGNQQAHMYCTSPEFWHNHAVSHELLP